MIVTKESPAAAESDPAGESPHEKALGQPDTERLVSLDVFRGFTMFWIVGGTMLMTGLAALGHNVILDTVVKQLDHTPWVGLRFYDCIWPSFMLMVGVSIPLARARQSLTMEWNQQVGHALKRALVLFLLGSVRESIFLNSPFLIELSSALQPIAIAYLVAFLVSRRSWRFQAGLAAAIMVSYACILAFIPAPGIAAGSYGFNQNLVHYVDIALLGQKHWDIWPFRNEGWGTVLVIYPAIATTLYGLIIGKLMMTKRSKGYKAKVIGSMGIGLFLLGLLLSPIIPIEMKLWTASYGLASAGVACLEYLFFYWLTDVVRSRRWAILFLPFGMNAVFIYMLTSLISVKAGTDVFLAPLAAHLGRAGLLVEALGAIGVEWLILYWMMKRRIFVKA
jgi:predicted acyltransferase